MRRPVHVLSALVILLVAPASLEAQTLLEAAAHATAIKSARAATGDWIPVLTFVPTTAQTVAPVTIIVGPTVTALPARAEVGILVGGAWDSLRAARLDALTLLGGRLAALNTLEDARHHHAVQYHEACAGQVASAGFLIWGVLVTTPNEDTPMCRAIASDLSGETAAFVGEHAAIEETARRAGVLPGVMRDLFASYDLPD